MKNLILLVFALMIGTASFGQSKFVKMKLPASMQSKQTAGETFIKDFTVTAADGRTKQRAQMRMVIPDKGEGLVSLELTENILTAGKIGTDFFVNNQEPIDSVKKGPHQLCIEYCNTEYTGPNGEKLKGRGWCKAGCWADTTVRVLSIVVVLVGSL